MKKLMVLDGTSLAHRAFYALPLLSTTSGQYTNAVLGFTNMLLRVVRQEQPDYLAVAFDHGRRTLRHQDYEAYKAHRKGTPDELRPQLPLIKKVLGAFNIPVLEAEGYEADDLIGTVVRAAEERGLETLVVTGDRDMLQLVSDHTRTLITRKGISELDSYGREDVIERYGLQPEQIPDLKGLIGDASDNIPGVPGIGEKTAVKMLQQYGTVESCLANREQFPARVASLLDRYAEQALMSKRLALLMHDIPVELDFEAFRISKPNYEELFSILTELEFKNLIKTIGAQMSPEEIRSINAQASPEEIRSIGAQASPGEIGGIGTGESPRGGEPEASPSRRAAPGRSSPGARRAPAAPGLETGGRPEGDGSGPAVSWSGELRNLMAKMRAAGCFALHTGTAVQPAPDPLKRVPRRPAGGKPPSGSGLDAGTGTPPPVGIADPAGTAASPPGAGVQPAGAVCMRIGFAWGAGESAAVSLTGDDAQKDELYACLAELLSGGEEKWCHDAKAEITAWRRCGITLNGISGDTKLAAHLLHSATNPTVEDVSLKHLNQVLLVSDDDRSVAQQARAIYNSWPLLRAELEEKGLYNLFCDIELPLSSVLAGMELAGVKLDLRQLEEMSREFGHRLAELTQEIYDLAGMSFNINSPRQLGVVLFEKLKLPVVKKTKTGYSTDAAVLEELSLYHDIAAKLLEYRMLLKLKSTYIDGLCCLVDPETGKLHTTFNQTITATGRLSSSEPNLQNIPIRMELGRKIRRAFVPSEPDWLILAADYSQVELRILAHMSRDEKLLEAFRRGEDIHTRTAAEVFGVPPAEVTPDLRRRAKGVNFGIVYGITDFGLARDIGVSREEAAVYIENYFRQHPGVRHFIQETIATARERGWVETLFKRRRYLPDLLSSNRQVRSFGERTAVNTPIQGTAADIIKLAMLGIDRGLRERGLQARMLLQVHDELVFEFPKPEQSELIDLVRTGMEQAVTLDVPLNVDIEIGPNWYDLTKVEQDA